MSIPLDVHESFPVREEEPITIHKTQREVFDYVDRVRTAIRIIESSYRSPTLVRMRCFDALNVVTELSDYLQTKMHPGT